MVTSTRPGPCGGVKAALQTGAPLMVEHWLAGVRHTSRLHKPELDRLPDEDARVRRLVELNVIEQVCNLSRLPQVQAAWRRGAELRLHGLVYGLHTGRLRRIGTPMDGRVGQQQDQEQLVAHMLRATA